MTRTKLLANIPNNPNLDDLVPSDFLLKYISKLITNLEFFVNKEISIGTISKGTTYHAHHELMQKIIGLPSAYTAVDGNRDTLAQFAREYSHMEEIVELDDLAKEVIVDFLNLHNGLFVVDLSNQDSIELSLEPPLKEDKTCILGTGQITMIPVNFPYGELTFLLIEYD